jgi:hypothetical protein
VRKLIIINTVIDPRSPKAMVKSHLRLVTPRTENRTVPRRKANAELRRREYLTGGLNLSTFHRGFTAAEKTEIWDRWKRGESLKAIGSIGPIDR